MAGYFKKRRIAGPSKNEQKLTRQRDAAAAVHNAARLGVAYPTVKRVNIHLVFLSPQQHTLDEKRLSLGPNDAIVLTADCPGRCGSAKFDLSAKLESVVASRVPAAEASAKCPEPLYADSPDACGVEIRCKVEIEYLPEPIA